MKYEARKRCQECGRVYDGTECPECGYYATDYEMPEDYEEENDIVEEAERDEK